MDLFKRNCVGTVHTVFAQYTKNRLEASVSFNKNNLIYYKGGSYHKPVLIPHTNVFILII